jgi:FdhD protein
MPASLGPVPGLGHADLVSDHPLLRVGEGAAVSESATIAEEVPIAMVYNAEPFVVVMASPADFEDLAVGFSVTEGIVSSSGDLRDIQVVKHSRGVELQMVVPDDAARRIAERRRGISARTGCGVCGIESIDEVLRAPRKVESAGRFATEALWRAAAELETRQPINTETRAVHAAALAHADGSLAIVREDVGRHNALDKVVGGLLRSGTSAEGCFLVVTSRASYELVQKTAAAGIPLLAAVSRPTSLAITLAAQANITLVGLLRGRSANVYSHPARLGLTPLQHGS